MDSIQISINEPEMDMKRGAGLAPAGGFARLMQMLLAVSNRLQANATPRRSIDREQQQYSPALE